MAGKKFWTVAVSDGVAEITLFSWKRFPAYIYKLLDHSAYIWRGQRCDDWKLESTLSRLMKKGKVARMQGPAFAARHLGRFKFAARGRRGSNPARLETDNDWWALGQHHGLATPLLDWTESPFAAAYFAFAEVNTPQTTHRAVYALHRPSVERKVRERIEAKQEENAKKKEATQAGKMIMKNALAAALLDVPPLPEVEFFRPLSDENQRLVSQAALFSRTPTNTSVEGWVRRNFPGETEHILLKILVPDKDREICLRMLNRMNLNHLTLFPDLYGSSVYTNLFGDIASY